MKGGGARAGAVAEAAESVVYTEPGCAGALQEGRRLTISLHGAHDEQASKQAR